jgi:hypothetical protein
MCIHNARDTVRSYGVLYVPSPFGHDSWSTPNTRTSFEPEASAVGRAVMQNLVIYSN